MPDIAHIGPSIGSTSFAASRPAHDALRPEAPRHAADRVEISDHARHLERLRSLPDVRRAKVEEIRDSIARGTYDTPERMSAALQRLLDELA